MFHSEIVHSPFSLSISLFVILFLGGVMPAPAQTNTTGGFKGFVSSTKDSAPIAGASVLIISQDNQIPIAKRTDSKGNFTESLLTPGNYLIVVNKPGFEEYKKVYRVVATEWRELVPEPIALKPIEETAVAPGAQPTPSPSPSPTSPGPATTEEADIRQDINRTDGRRDGTFSEKEVVTLPLGATTLVRTFDELALLLPGVAPPPQTQGSVAGPGIGAGVGSAGQFSVNGLRSRGNNFTVDGSDNNDEDIGVRRQGFLSLVPQPIESIKEYHVITLLAPAQYGRNFGAQVDALSKSGSNRTHGTFYGFLNSSQLNAGNFFDRFSSNGTTPLQGQAPDGTMRNVFVNGQQKFVTNDAGNKDSSTLVQAGMVLGGPLVPARSEKPYRSLYYFLSMEGQLLHANRKENFAVPTVEQRGIFNSGATGTFNFNKIPSYPTSAQGDAVFSLFPFPNNPNGIFGRNTLTESLRENGRGKVLSGKVDGNFRIRGSAQSLTARYNFTDDARTIPVTGQALFSSLRPSVRTQNFSTFLNSEISDRLSNQLRASYGRTRLNFQEAPDRNFLIPSCLLPNNPFLLNAPILVNTTLPGDTAVTYTSIRNNGDPCNNNITGPFGTTEVGFVDPNGSFGTFAGGAIGALGQVNIAGFSPLGVDVFNFPQQRTNNTFQIADTATWRLGSRHNIAFGEDIRRTELRSNLPRNSRPLLTFNGGQIIDPSNNFKVIGFLDPASLAAASAASGFSQALDNSGSSNIDLRYYQYNFFGQDEWRMRPNLSFSYGLRYEYNSPPQEANRVIENTFNSPLLSDPSVSGLSQFIAGRTGIYDPDHRDFAPRIGVAYSPRLFGDRTSVVRAGFGIFYDQILGAVVSQSRNVFPNFLTLDLGGGLLNVDRIGTLGAFNLFNPSLAFAGGQAGNGICLSFDANRRCTDFQTFVAPSTLNQRNPNIPLSTLLQVLKNSFASSGFGLTLPARRLRTPMAEQYAVTFEQQLNKNTFTSVAYVGTRGRHLLRLTTPNLGPNETLALCCFLLKQNIPEFFGMVLPPGGHVSSTGQIIGGRPVSGAGAVNIYETSANSRYDALQAQVRGRFMQRLQYQANYTFSRADDDASDVFDLAGAPALPQDSLTRAGEYGPSNFDARHRFSYNIIYDLPAYHERGRLFRSLLGGLELASTGQFQTAQPFTVNSIFDVNGDGNLTDRPNSTNGIVATGDRSQPYRLTVDPTTLLAPIGQDGSVGRNRFRASNLLLINVAVIKNLLIREDQRLILRVELMNVTNRANFGIPVRFLEAPGFGRATETITPGFRVQFALKYSF